MTITIETVGRRHYLIGQTYPIREAIRAAGAKWDAERKAWYTGLRERAEQLVQQAAAAPQPVAPASAGERNDTPRDGEDSIVAGRATYKGTTYYVAGRTVRGRTHWDDSVEQVTTRDGAKVLLYFRDGSRQFWAARGDVQLAKTYDRPQTIARLAEFARETRENGGVHPDACPQCGSTSCERAYGRTGLCDED